MNKTWFERTKLDRFCSKITHCEDCEPSGLCTNCNTIEGEVVKDDNNFYLCSGCRRSILRQNLKSDPETGEDYCTECQKILTREERRRLE